MSSTPSGWNKPASDIEPAAPPRPIEHSPFVPSAPMRSRQALVLWAAVLIAVGLFVAREASRIVDDPDVAFLGN